MKKGDVLDKASPFFVLFCFSNLGFRFGFLPMDEAQNDAHDARNDEGHAEPLAHVENHVVFEFDLQGTRCRCASRR